MKRALRWLSSSGGVADAGASAFATFLVGLQAVGTLTASQLALFSLLFGGALIVMLLPNQLVYLPTRIQLLSIGRKQVSRFKKDLFRSAPLNASATVLVVLAATPLLVAGGSVDALNIGMTASVALFVVVSPFQDHVRASLHLIKRHWTAAALSFVLLAVVMVTLALVGSSRVNEIGLFGSLALGNLASILVGILILRRTPRCSKLRLPTFQIRLGYLGSDLIIQTASYLSGVIVFMVLGVNALAALEAARIVAAPVFVFVAGVSAVLVPEVVRNVYLRKESYTVSSGRLITTLLSAGLAYSFTIPLLAPVIGVLTGRDIPIGLTFSRAVASSIEGAGNALASPLFALNNVRGWIFASATGVGCSMALLVITLPYLDVAALPVAMALGMLIRLIVGFRIFTHGGIRRE